MSHKDFQSGFYDFYMDFSSSTIKKFYLFVFNTSKLIRLILIYFLFYHTIWWTKNSITNNLAINYSLINSKLFFILIYFNYYEILINQILLRFFCFNIFKSLKLFNLNRTKSILSLMEMFIYFLISMLILWYLKVNQNYSIKFTAFFVLPHLIFMLYHHFDIEITLFNYCLCTNEASKPKIEENHHSSDLNDHQTFETSQSQASKNAFVYTDCSNISINTFLNQKYLIPGVTNVTNKSQSTIQTSNGLDSASSNDQTSKLVKQSFNLNHRSKSKHGLSKTWLLNNRLRFFLKSTLDKCVSFSNKTVQFILSMPKTSRIKIIKRNSFLNLSPVSTNSNFNCNLSLTSTTNFVLNTNLINQTNLCCMHHKCQKDAFALRQETEIFRCEFGVRIREAFVRSFETIYFLFFLARICLPSHVNIREKEYYLYLICTILCTFISYFTYYIPMSFLISLNQNAEHLGFWSLECTSGDERRKSQNYCASNKSSLNSNLSLPTVNKWISTKVYFRGDRVNFMGRIYKVETLYCASVPGNKQHESFFKFFSKPLKIILILVVLKTTNIILLCLFVSLNGRWYAILTNIFEILINSHTFFIIFRDFFILLLKKDFDPSSVNNDNINNKKID